MLRLAFSIPRITALQLLFLLMLSITFSTPDLSGAQSFPGNITIEEGGRIWIEGTAGPVDFSCRAEKLSGQGEIENVQEPRTSITEEGQLNISVSLPVKTLNCGKRAMNKDMYGALKADEFPQINYQLLEASLTDDTADTTTGEWMNIRTKGVMEIAGVEDTTSVFVQGRIINNNQFQVKGSKKIHMDTYNIDPPSKMFGLIRANKELTVHFDVTVSLADILN